MIAMRSLRRGRDSNPRTVVLAPSAVLETAPFPLWHPSAVCGTPGETRTRNRPSVPRKLHYPLSYGGVHIRIGPEDAQPLLQAERVVWPGLHTASAWPREHRAGAV